MGENPAEQFPYPEKLDLLRKAVVELVMVHQAGRKEFRSEAAPELHKGKGAFTFSICYSELIQTGGAEQILSSLEANRAGMLKMAVMYSTLYDFFEPKYEFSEGIDEFAAEIVSLLVLFDNSVKIIRDPSTGTTVYPEFSREDNGKFDLAIMKALFQAGKIIERLESEGWKTSDWGKETGSGTYKGYVSYDDVRQAAKKVSKRIKSKRGIARAVRKRLVKNEEGKKNPRKVYTVEHIRKEILKGAWSESS